MKKSAILLFFFCLFLSKRSFHVEKCFVCKEIINLMFVPQKFGAMPGYGRNVLASKLDLWISFPFASAAIGFALML